MPQKQSEPGLCSFFILIINLKKVSEELEDWKLLKHPPPENTGPKTPAVLPIGRQTKQIRREEQKKKKQKPKSHHKSLQLSSKNQAHMSSSFQTILGQGVLHGDTELRNILWNDIVKCLIIVDFGQVSIRFCWWTKRRTAPSFLEQSSAKMLVHGLVRKMTITGHLWLVDWNVCSKF
ncbi:hypothetical protein CIHG_10249 [Coccidioides immitis H538.4]|uniref:Protein kinase domain-containing protein n=1 Tax=Coccidioides immitis H538.4 TaxID=396776 RepID=A0A0J8S7R7_COCIT|nr:hypothetical protein CIHG_10249 [Coccidioides immitis H538.4]